MVHTPDRISSPQPPITRKEPMIQGLPGKEAKGSPEFYKKKTEKVREQLTRFGFGEAIQFLTPDGMDRKAYLSYARTQLLGQEYADGVEGKKLPQKIGEVDIPKDVQDHIGNAAIQDWFVNTGYGHYRPAAAIGNTAELIGAKVENIFLGGPKNNFPGTDLDETLRALCRGYVESSLELAAKEGMITDIPLVEDPNPKATKLVNRVIRVLKLPVYLSKGIKEKNFSIGLAQAKSDIFKIKDSETPSTIKLKTAPLKLIIGNALVDKIQQFQEQHPGKDYYVFTTHGVFAPVLSNIRRSVQKSYTSGHYESDTGMVKATYTRNPHSYVESFETAKKWSYEIPNRKKDESGMPKDVTVLDGYVSPLSVYKRGQLTLERQQALREGQPLTIIATASGVAPVQEAPFLQLLTDAKQQLKDGKLRMVIQCGAEEGYGLVLYNKLQEFVSKEGLEENVALHIAATPEAAIDAFELMTWAPVPLGIYTKGAEVARMANTLNIPYIPTGIVGDHEAWNIAVTALKSPHMITFPKSVGQHYAENAQRIFSHDIFMQNNPEYLPKLLATISERTAENIDQLLSMTNQYIASGEMTTASAGAILYILEDLISRRHPQEKMQEPIAA